MRSNILRIVLLTVSTTVIVVGGFAKEPAGIEEAAVKTCFEQAFSLKKGLKDKISQEREHHEESKYLRRAAQQEVTDFCLAGTSTSPEEGLYNNETETSEEEPLFYDDFENEITSGWKVDNGRIEDGVLKVGSGKKAGSAEVLGSLNWTDYTVEVRMKLISSGANIVFRKSGIATYAFSTHNIFSTFVSPTSGRKTFSIPKGHKFALTEISGQKGFSFHEAKEVSPEPARGVWHDVRIEVRGTQAHCFFNGKMVLEYTQLKSTMGGVELSSQGGEVYFDDVKISKFEEPESLLDRANHKLEVSESIGHPEEGMFRANLRHTGYYDTQAVHKFNEIKWKFNFGTGVPSSPLSQEGILSSPVIHKEVVYFGSPRGHLYAVDIETGKERWNFKTEGIVNSSPAIDNDVVYFGSCDEHFYGVNIKTGQQKWKFKTWDYIRSSPAVANGLVYFGGDDNKLHAVNIETGEERWSLRKDRPVLSSPALADGMVFFGCYDGYLYAIEDKTGQEKWKFKTGDGIRSSPAIADGVVYFGSEDGHLYAVDIETGEEKWNFETFDTSYPVLSSPAIAGGTVIFGSHDDFLYAVDARTGQEKWRFRTRGSVFSSPAIADGVVYFGSDDGHLYAVDIKTGREKWRYKTGNRVCSSPAVADGVVFFCCDNGYLYAVR